MRLCPFLSTVHMGVWGASESDITVPVWIVIGLPTDGDAATGAESTQQLSSEGNTLHTHTHRVRRHSVDLSTVLSIKFEVLIKV